MEITFTQDKLPEAARSFVHAMGNRTLFAFRGGMGAGKTTLISEICRLFGVADDTGSPTFSIINEYQRQNGDPIYHFDFYRLDSPEDAMNIGAEDYFYSGNLCLMEWPEKVEDILPQETVDVFLNVNPDGSRTLTMTDA